ncbi:MAG TPA: hypothetical protein VKA14_07290, partial [Gammaproteobacteria bacterium]|nr:hypothetical protein [Gammaproteobacteria bacterium]
ARLLRDQLRWADLVAVTQAGDFVAALPETDAGDAAALAAKLAARVQELAVEGAPIRVRYGVSSWRRGDHAPTLLARAAQAARVAQVADTTPAAL